MNINGEEVANKRKVYEKSRLVAWSNEDSILKLATVIMKENAEMKSKFAIDAIEVSAQFCLFVSFSIPFFLFVCLFSTLLFSELSIESQNAVLINIIVSR